MQTFSSKKKPSEGAKSTDPGRTFMFTRKCELLGGTNALNRYLEKADSKQIPRENAFKNLWWTTQLKKGKLIVRHSEAVETCVCMIS